MKYIHISADNPGAIYAVPDKYADHLSKYARSFLTWLEQSKQAKQHRITLTNSAVCLSYSERDFADYLQRKCHQCTLVLDLDAEGVDPNGADLPPEYRDIPSFHF